MLRKDIIRYCKEYWYIFFLCLALAFPIVLLDFYLIAPAVYFETHNSAAIYDVCFLLFLLIESLPITVITVPICKAGKKNGIFTIIKFIGIQLLLTMSFTIVLATILFIGYALFRALYWASYFWYYYVFV